MCNEHVSFDCCPALLGCYQPECTCSVLISNGTLSSWGALIRDETGILSAGSRALFPGAGFWEVMSSDVSGAVCVCERAAAPQA